jgi:hypothetical protein
MALHGTRLSWCTLGFKHSAYKATRGKRKGSDKDERTAFTTVLYLLSGRP